MNRVVPAPLPGEIEDIVRRVHRRRRADVAGALALSFAVALGASSVLRAGDTSAVQPATTVVPTPTRPGPSVTARPVSPLRRDPAVQPAGAPVRQAAAPQRTADVPAAAPSPDTPARPGKPPVAGGAVARPADMCDQDIVREQVDGEPPCVDVRVEQAATTTTFLFYLCTHAEEGVETITFPTEQEVDYVVRRDGADLWTWSKGQRFGPDGRTFQLSGDTCYRWTVVWDRTDENGRALPPGTYTLHGTTLADLDGAQQHQDTDFTLE